MQTGSQLISRWMLPNDARYSGKRKECVWGVGREEGDLSWTILEGTKEGSYGEYMGGRITL